MASNSLESSLARESVGYLSKEEYKRKREALEQEEKLQRMKAALAPPKEPPAPTASAAAKKKKKKKGAATGSLSFGDELDEGDDALAAPKKSAARRLVAPAKPAPLNTGAEVMQLEPIV